MILTLSPSFVFLFCSTHFLLLFHAFVTCYSLPPLCHVVERSALLQFRDSFVIDCQASLGDPFAYPKVEYWKLRHDCCSWDGVTCDYRSGHVVGLDLSSSCLFGSINSTISLFHLLHLRTLNLAFNNFNHSQIPSDLANLSELTSLNLSIAYFHGQIPPNISQLSKLSTLDLTSNDGFTSNDKYLMLENSVFHRLVENLTSLEYLRLSHVERSSPLPLTLANLSSLKSLRLSVCGLYGEFPIGIFQLPHLQTLQVDINPDLKGHLPEFNVTSPLQALALGETSFSGELPDSIGNLASLHVLGIAYCGFFGKVPTSLGNLLELEMLELDYNNFEVKNSSSLSWLGKLTRLRGLGLSRISLNEVFPLYFANLTQLNFFALTNCEIDSQIPPWLMNMTQLVYLDLTNNQLQGPIPDSVFQLTNLQYLHFFGNNLSVDNLKNLKTLDLSHNNLSLLCNHVSNITSMKLFALGLGRCNLNHVPNFLRYKGELGWLNLSDNFIHGSIPTWIWNDSLKVLDLSCNFLTGFEQHPILFPPTLIALDLSGNMLHGSLPIPPPSIEYYGIHNNYFSGYISPIICNLNALDIFDLSYNNFSGTLPSCFANFSSSIKILSIEGNKFQGKIPDSYTQVCNLRMRSLDSNDLEGEVPRSLSHCTKLECLILGNNQIKDVFPSWLGSLQELKVLVLRSNRFYGGLMEDHNFNFNFPKLHIIDISYNNFSGKLPSQYFLNWNSMKIVEADQLVYMNVSIGIRPLGAVLSIRPGGYLYSMTITSIRPGGYLWEQYFQLDLIGFMVGKLPAQYFLNWNSMKIVEADQLVDMNIFTGIRYLAVLTITPWDYLYSMTITNKGTARRYSKILESLVAIDFSSNNFEGSIPQAIGNLNGLHLLNLSNNNLSGSIPTSLANLTELECLDLSRNNFVECFLSVFNVSYNHLTGSIPHGEQFDTFDNSSYQNNSGLCGDPLSRKCQNLTSSTEEEGSVEDSDSFFEFSWKPVVIGYGCGLIVGAVIGWCIIITRNLEWFLKTFKIRRGRRRI